ncbi:MAG: aldehyde dehydrogenase family protein [Nitrososphaerota archaeon]
MSSGAKITYVTLMSDPSIHPAFEEALKNVEEKLGKSYPMYIGDEEVWSGAGEFEDRSPIDTSILIGRFQRAERKHVTRAIETADSAFAEWSRTSWRERVEIMRRAAEIIDRRKFEIAATICLEVGKNRFEALAECWEAIDALRYYANIMEESRGYEREMGPGAPGEQCKMVAKPYGAWVVISPFNFPFMLANGMILGALLTGNTVVFKPTSEAPLSGLHLYSVFREAGVPAGAINYVTGPGDIFEEEVTGNTKVAGIAFTGSRDVGMRLYRRFLSSQPHPKPIVLEMGSKNPTIVTAKADLEKAVTGVIRAAFGYDGQKCSATSRLYVEESIMDRFLERLVAETSRLKVGDPRERDTFMGPVVNKRAVENFRKYIEEARRSGGRILFGGEVLSGGIYDRGYYVQPTIIADLPLENHLWRDELFLPILLVASFKTLQEALKMANNTEFGLTAGIFSEDPDEVRYFFDTIEFGVCYANRRGGATTGAWPGAQTFVGWKASGATGRGVGGPHYLLNYLREQAQTVVVEKQ